MQHDSRGDPRVAPNKRGEAPASCTSSPALPTHRQGGQGAPTFTSSPAFSSAICTLFTRLGCPLPMPSSLEPLATAMALLFTYSLRRLWRRRQRGGLSGWRCLLSGNLQVCSAAENMASA